MGSKRVKKSDKERTKKSKPQDKAEKVPERKKVKVIEGIRGMVRIAEADILGHRKLNVGLLKIKGVGKSLATGIPKAIGLDANAMTGSLSDEELKKLEDVVRNPTKYGIPFHMVNRRRDPYTGEDTHLVSSELKFTVKSDIDAMRKMRSYKGKRHESGLPVRGQRTRSSFRKGKRVGVQKKGRGIARGAPKQKSGGSGGGAKGGGKKK